MLNHLTPLEETRAYQSIFAKGEAEGEAKGEAKGKAEGEAKGKADSLKRLLEHRFGALPTWAAARIEQAEIAQLDAWLDDLMETTGIEDLLSSKAS